MSNAQSKMVVSTAAVRKPAAVPTSAGGGAGAATGGATPASAPVAAATAAAAGTVCIPSAKHASGEYRLPELTTLQHACKLATIEDKPILMDYWVASLENSVIIGVREDGEKLLVKSEEEYTSAIAKVFKMTKDYIIMTENSIYLCCATTPIKRISSAN